MRPRRSLHDRLHEQLMPITETGCWIFLGTVDSEGYGRLGSGGRHGKVVRAHRASYELHHGAIPPGMVVLHACDVTGCCNPDHLRLGSQDDNMKDMVNKKRGVAPHHRGEANGRSRLSPAQVADIRARYATGAETQQCLAAAYGMSRSAISSLVRGASWGHIQPTGDKS